MRPASGSVPAERGRLHYERAGRGPAVVLIHPGLWDSRLWDGQFASLAKQHDVIRYDLRGSGRSEAASAPYSDVQDLLEVMVFLDVERATLVGLSAGAAVAIDFALAYPEMVAGLVPASPVLSGYEWNDPGMDMLRQEMASGVEAGRPERAVEVALSVWAPLETDPIVDERIREIAMENASRLLGPDLAQPAPPAEDRLHEIQAPTMVIVGESG
ncbi:MAG: alpha/beta hydrolase [Actinobacteria bacterium]|nr:MAG: alpha/beta hydrolase [Actinomycetota bacterium]